MRDRILTYAIVISIVAHLGVVGVVGYTYASRLSTGPVLTHPKFINVDLVNQSKSQQAKPLRAPKVSPPKPVVVPPPPHSAARIDEPPPDSYRPRPGHAAPVSVSHNVPGNPGGKLNTGSNDPHGDVTMASNGHTPSGWVPNPNTESPGQGSGTGSGVGTPDPPKHADPGPGTHPAPAPVAPPPPKMVSVEVCSESGQLPNKWCQHKRNKEFADGNQPSRTCTECKEPFKSTLADRAEPVLTHDARVDVPSSVEEGLSVSVKVTFTITEEGSVTDASVTSSSGNKLIDRAAVSAVQKRRYQPAVQGGIARSVKRSVTFRINT